MSPDIDIINYLPYGGAIILVIMLAYLFMRRGVLKRENQTSLNNESGKDFLKMDYESTVDRLQKETKFSAWSVFFGLIFSGLLILSAGIDGITNYLAAGDAMYFINYEYKAFIQGGVAFSATTAFLVLGIYYFGFAANKRAGFFSLGSAWVLFMWLAVGTFSGFMSFCTMSQAVDSKSLPDWEIAQQSQLYSEASRVSREVYGKTKLQVCLKDETCSFIKNEIKDEWTGEGGRSKSCGPICKNWLKEYEVRIKYILGDDWDRNEQNFYAALEAAARGDRSKLSEAVQVVPSPVLLALTKNGMSVRNLLNPQLGGVMDYFMRDVFSNRLTVAGGILLVLITMCLQAVGAHLLWTEVLKPIYTARNKLKMIKISYTSLLEALENHGEQHKSEAIDKYMKLVKTGAQPIKKRGGSSHMVIKSNTISNDEGPRTSEKDPDVHCQVITHSFISSGLAFYLNSDLYFQEDLFYAAISLARKEIKRRAVSEASDLLESVNTDLEAAREEHLGLLERYRNEITDIEDVISDRETKLASLDHELEQARIQDQGLLERFQNEITDIDTAISDMAARIASLDLEFEQAREQTMAGGELEREKKVVEVKREIDKLRQLSEQKKLDKRILVWITSGLNSPLIFRKNYLKSR